MVGAGLDVVKAAILGAESFGFGTLPMVVGWVLAYLNNCATGVATQRDDLRKEHYIGTADMVKKHVPFIPKKPGVDGTGPLAEELVGRTDLLEMIDGLTDKQRHLDLMPLLANDHIPADKPHTVQVERNHPYDAGALAESMVRDILPAIEQKAGGEFSYRITNCDRSIGARLSGEIARRYGNQGYGFQPGTPETDRRGGQSFGVWNAGWSGNGAGR